MIDPYNLLRPMLFRIDPEAAHDRMLRIMAKAPAAALRAAFPAAPARPVSLWGLMFRNPLGLAAGLDKNAVALDAWYHLGFGFCEVGTVTPLPQPGNPKPRIFRLLQQEAIINRMGFPNDGAAAVRRRLAKFQELGRRDFPVGVNIGKGRETSLSAAHEDYAKVMKELHDVADYFVVNVSSPNTPGLRGLQTPEHLRIILSALSECNSPRRPLLVKISPDLEEHDLAGILRVLSELSVDGIVATNTTLDRSGIDSREEGGLSGRPLAERSTRIIRFIHQSTRGTLPIIGVGGVMTRSDFDDKIFSGARLVQVYTGLIYRGPGIVRECLGEVNGEMAHV